jgi:hypothetical protein
MAAAAGAGKAAVVRARQALYGKFKAEIHKSGEFSACLEVQSVPTVPCRSRMCSRLP